MTDGLKGAAGLGIKLGLEFFGEHAGGVKVWQRRAGTIFLDKFHDIPNTVAGSIRGRAARARRRQRARVGRADDDARCGAAAGQAATKAGAARPAVLAVTVLTSMDEDLWPWARPARRSRSCASRSSRRSAAWTASCARRAKSRRSARRGADFLLVVPGIGRRARRLATERVLTPAEGVKAGASNLVVGRPITQAAEPRQAAAAILEEANAAAQ